MIYTDMTKKAMTIAYNVHMGQVDKSGLPYIFHPVHLAEQMSNENTTIVALLHDVVEDTEITFEDLTKGGFSIEVIEALRLMTHDENICYMDYVVQIKANPIARMVKLADLKHNSDITRLDIVAENAKEQIEKYSKAIELLSK